MICCLPLLLAASSLAASGGAGICEEIPDADSCALVDTGFQEAINEVLQAGEYPAGSSTPDHSYVLTALYRHKRLHGWLQDEDGLPRHRTCPRGDLLRLREWGVMLAKARYCRLVRPIVGVLERNGRADDAVTILSNVPLVPPPDGVGLPPGFVAASDWRCCNLDALLGEVERRRGRWEQALAHYEAWRGDRSCVGPSGRIRDGRRLECLAELGRWEEYRALCRERLHRRMDWPFVSHLIESYRAQDALARAELDVLLSLAGMRWCRKPPAYSRIPYGS